MAGDGERRTGLSNGSWSLQLGDDSNMTSNASCLGFIDTLSNVQGWTLLAVALAVAIFNAFLVRRKSTGARGGIPTPIELLLATDVRQRLLYCVAFGASLGGALNLFRGLLVEESSNVIVEVLAKFFSLGLVPLLYYPIFLGVRTASSIFGSSIALFYTISLLICKIVYLAQCPGVLASLVLGLANVPGIICLTSLVIFFAYQLAILCRDGFRTQNFVLEHEEEEPLRQPDEEVWQTEYVRRLFSRSASPSVGVSSRWTKVKHGVYDPNQPFRYSLRLLISIVVSGCIIYWFLMVFIFAYIVFEGPISHASNLKARYLASWALTSFFSAACVASVFAGIQLYFVAHHYRKDMLAMYKGRHPMQPDRVKVADMSFKAMQQNNFTQFAGYQTAIVCMGYLYQTFVLFIAFAALSFFIMYGQLTSAREAANHVFALIVPGLIALFLFVLQHILVHFVFLEDGGRLSLTVNNRRLYNNFAYLSFFVNLVIGALSSLLRIGLSFAVSSIFIYRLNKTIVNKPYDKLDKGYTTYITFLRMENEMTNPCLVVFARILLGVQGAQRTAIGYGSISADGDSTRSGAAGKFRVSRRAKNRWLVAVTMIQNPSVIASRRGTNTDSGWDNTVNNSDVGGADYSAKDAKVTSHDVEEGRLLSVDDDTENITDVAPLL